MSGHNCTICQEFKPLSEYSSGTRTDGTASACKVCMRAYKQEWSKQNKDRERDRWARYREENQETIRDKARTRMRARRAADPEGSKLYTREYRANNSNKVKQWDAKKRATRKGARGAERITADCWQFICAMWGNACAYCQEPTERPQLEHIQALSRGGRHEIGNIVPACAYCNNSKGAKDVLEWINEHQRMSTSCKT